MTDQKFAQQAAIECSSAATAAHIGGGEGRPFWNPEATQFMYVPAFQFQPYPGCGKYRYAITDSEGREHSFESRSSGASLEPVWKDIPEGVTELRVFATDAEGKDAALAGARTFFRLSPFPADLPGPAGGYREAAARAYDHAFAQSFIQHWLTDGTPDPDYDRYVYPSKMISYVIEAMVHYSSLRPEHAAAALTVAKNAADWLIGITPGEREPTAHIPPTYCIDFRDHPETRTNLKATERIDWVMMIYPARVGTAYLGLERATGERRYFDAALRIGEWYRDNVRENGSWPFILRKSTGEVISSHYCAPMAIIVPFLECLFDRTGDEVWRKLAEGAVEYTEKKMLPTYNWEGQFEDSSCSENYSNLSHYAATPLIRYWCRYCRDDEKRMAQADELMRFVEDQFVVWRRPAPWNRNRFDTSTWMTPFGAEQYKWYMPIDASTADICRTFLAMYRAGRGELHLEKAKALADAITRSQRPDGMIPTYWMNEEYLNGKNLWINCMFFSAMALEDIAEETEV